jgi:hypothetical protein
LIFISVSGGDYRDPLLIPIHPLKTDNAIGQCIETVVTCTGNIFAGQKPGAALAHNDCTGANQLAGKCLDSQSLPRAVASVFCGPAAFLMCHNNSFCRDCGEQFILRKELYDKTAKSQYKIKNMIASRIV